MPSNLPKVNFVLSEDELALVRQYQKDNNIKSLSKAFVELVSKGLVNEERRMAEEAVRKAEQPAEGGELSKREQKLISLMADLPPEEQNLILDLCIALASEYLRHRTIAVKESNTSLSVSSR